MGDDEEEYEYDYGSDQDSHYDYGSDQGDIDNGVGEEAEGDDLKNENPQEAIAMFEKVVELESAIGDQVKWRFKALQNLSSNNERLWFNTNLKLTKLYLEDKKLNEVERLISSLKKTCQTADGKDDLSKGSYLLEVYCLEIQLSAVTHNTARMKEIYPKTVNLNAAVLDPRIMGVIREEGGKMQMAEGNWEDAYNELYEAFRNYQEAGNSRAKDCLKYVVLASMLSLSDINPFAAREAKVFSDDKEIVAMSELRMCLEKNDLSKFERTIRDKKNRIMDEPFLMTYIQPLRQRMREQVLLNLLKPYNRVTLPFLANELLIQPEEVETMLVEMILDNKLDAAIDQSTDQVTLHRTQQNQSLEDRRTQQLGEWAANMEKVSAGFASRLS
eukprot:gene29451-38547_t